MSTPHEAWTETDEPLAVLDEAATILERRLRPPMGRLAHRWSAAEDGNDLRIKLNETLPLVAAWSGADPAVARDILLSAFALQQADGSLPAEAEPDGTRLAGRAPWPLFAQAATCLGADPSQAGVVGALLPRLEAYLRWSLACFSQRGARIPRWNSPEEAFVPETCDQGLVTADLTVFLLCEIEALRELGGRYPGVLQEDAFFDEQRDILRGHLERFFWDPAQDGFRDRYDGGEHISRATLSAVLPLAWRGLPAQYRKPLLALLQARNGFYADHGLPLWVAWAEDEMMPPAPALPQAVAWFCLQRVGLREQLSDRARTLLHRLDRFAGITGQLPADTLQTTRIGAELAGQTSSPASSACLALILRQCMGRAPGTGTGAAPASALLRLLERHRAKLAVALATALLAAVVLIVMRNMHKDRPTISQYNAISGLAAYHYYEGRYEESAALYEELLQASHGTRVAGDLKFRLGLIRLRQERYAEAERFFREALDAGHDTPQLLLNLGHTLYRQGRKAEAAPYYRTLIEKYDEAYPSLAERAQKALNLTGAALEDGPAEP